MDYGTETVSPFNSIEGQPAYTETLQLFNTTFNKKTGPPKKVSIVDPIEFKDDNKYKEMVTRGNVSYEIVKKIQRINRINTIELIKKLSEPVDEETFDKYYDNLEDKEFLSSVDIYLQELSFLQEYATRGIPEFRMEHSDSRAQPSMVIENHLGEIFKLSEEEHNHYNKQKERIEIQIEVKRDLIEKQAKFLIERKKEEHFQKLQIEAEKQRKIAEDLKRQTEDWNHAVKIRKERLNEIYEERRKAAEEMEQMKKTMEIKKKQLMLESHNLKMKQLYVKDVNLQKEKEQNQITLKKQIEDKIKIQMNRYGRKENYQIRKRFQAELEKNQKERDEYQSNFDKINDEEKSLKHEIQKKQETIDNIHNLIDYIAKRRIVANETISEFGKEVQIQEINIISDEKKKKEVEFNMFEAQNLFLIENAKVKTQQEKLEKKANILESFLESTANQHLNMEKQKLIHEFQSYISTAKITEKVNHNFDLIKEYDNYQILSELQNKQKKENNELNIIFPDKPISLAQDSNENKKEGHFNMTKGQLKKFEDIFDYDFYVSNYSDVKDLSKNDAINHYMDKGKKEGHIISKKHAQFLTNSEDFDIIKYKIEYCLQELSLRDVCIHFMSHGKPRSLLDEISEKIVPLPEPVPSKTTQELLDEIAEKIVPLPDKKESNTNILQEPPSQNFALNPSREINTQYTESEQIDIKNDHKKHICVIYSYYEKKNQNKNQSNLAYFLRHGMNENLWKEMDITLLLIINGNQCEVNIPKKDNIIVWERDYDASSGGRDIGSYRKGIEFLENKYQKPFFVKFNYLFVTNSSCTGPFWNTGKENHWLDPFIYKMEKDKSVLCSPIINFLPSSDAGGPGPRAQSYCALIKMNFTIYKLLLHTVINRLSKGSTNREVNNAPYTGRVFDVHPDTSSTILLGEYGMSRVLIENGFKISSLIFSSQDYQDKSSWMNFPDRVDRNPHFQLQFLKKCVFIKNNWNVSDNTYDSVPVFYGKTIDLINRNLKMKNFMDKEENTIEMDFENLPITTTGKYRGKESLLFKDRPHTIQWIKWYSKKEHYLIFGKANQVHLFPKQNAFNTSVVIYTHFHPKNLVPDYVIQGLKTLMILNYDILFWTACDHIKNVDFPFQIYHRSFPNTVPINDRHKIMFSEAILKTKLIKYDYVLSLNDTLIFPIHGVKNMKESIKNLRKENDYWSLFNNIEMKDISFCEFSKKSIPFLKQFLGNKQKNDKDLTLKNMFIENEIKIGKILEYSKLRSEDDYMKNIECFGIEHEEASNLFFNKDEQTTNNTFNFLSRYLL